MTTEKKTPEALAKALEAVLDAYHRGRLVPFDSRSVGYVKSVIEAGEEALASAPNDVTPEMIEAGAKAAREYLERTGGNSPAVIYRAMRAAALASAQAQQEPDICGTCDGRGCPVCKPEPNPHTVSPVQQEPVARVEFTGRKKPDVEWLTDEVHNGTLLYTAPPVQQEPVARPFWSYRRYGSEPEKGYTIIAKRNEHATNGEPVAYLGDGPILGDACHAICEAHNAAPSVQQGPMGREGCNYMCMPGKVCRKCGHVHDIPLTVPPVQQAIRPDPCPDIKGFVSGGGLDHVMSKVRAGVVPVWKLVPVEPTEAMLDAGNDPTKGGYNWSQLTAADVYRAMLSAAPEWSNGISCGTLMNTDRKDSPLNAAPPAHAAVVNDCLTTQGEKRQGLTDEQIHAIDEKHRDKCGDDYVIDFARAIEKAHSITPADAKEDGNG